MKKTKKFLSFVPGALIMAVLFTGCPSATQMVDDVSNSLASEQFEYDQLVNMAGAHGEQVTHQLERWSHALGRLYGNVADIKKRLSKKPEERAKVQSKLDLLRERLDAVLSRDVELRLSIPSWQMNEARSATRYANDALNNLRNKYFDLYQVAAPSSSVFRVEVSVDPYLRDTKDECIEKIKLVGLAHRDDRCFQEARVRCGHQMDMNCVDRKAILGAAVGCTKRLRDPELGSYVEFPADWLSEISACKSATPVFRR